MHLESMQHGDPEYRHDSDTWLQTGVLRGEVEVRETLASRESDFYNAEHRLKCWQRLVVEIRASKIDAEEGLEKLCYLIVHPIPDRFRFM
jgi:hypothetical protein